MWLEEGLAMFFAKGLKFMHSNLKCFNFLCEWSSITDEGSSAWLYARPTNSHFAWYSITEIISSTHTHTQQQNRDIRSYGNWFVSCSQGARYVWSRVKLLAARCVSSESGSFHLNSELLGMDRIHFIHLKVSGLGLTGLFHEVLIWFASKHCSLLSMETWCELLKTIHNIS